MQSAESSQRHREKRRQLEREKDARLEFLERKVYQLEGELKRSGATPSSYPPVSETTESLVASLRRENYELRQALSKSKSEGDASEVRSPAFILTRVTRNDLARTLAGQRRLWAVRVALREPWTEPAAPPAVAPASADDVLLLGSRAATALPRTSTSSPHALVRRSRLGDGHERLHVPHAVPRATDPELERARWRRLIVVRPSTDPVGPLISSNMWTGSHTRYICCSSSPKHVDRIPHSLHMLFIFPLVACWPSLVPRPTPIPPALLISSPRPAPTRANSPRPSVHHHCSPHTL